MAEEVGLVGEYCKVEDRELVNGFMECLRVESGNEILSYVHENWGQYAAAVINSYGNGTGVYLGCMFSKKLLKKVLQNVMDKANIIPNAGSDGFPVIVRSGTNTQGKRIDYLFNYSGEKQSAWCPQKRCQELLSGKMLQEKDLIVIPEWGVIILEEVL